VRLKTRVDGIDEKGVHIGSELIQAATVLWTAGVTCAPPHAIARRELRRAGRIIVEQDLSVPGHPKCSRSATIACFIPKAKPTRSPASAQSRSKRGATPRKTSMLTLRSEPRQAVPLLRQRHHGHDSAGRARSCK
jgi:NADH dehydrogenase